MSAKNNNIVTLRGVTEELTKVLNQFRVESYELRNHSQNGIKLYLRMVPTTPDVKLTVVDGE